jgi:hypothetical protein
VYRWLHGSEKAINLKVTVGDAFRSISYIRARIYQPAPSVSANLRNSQKIFSGHSSDLFVCQRLAAANRCFEAVFLKKPH